ncbi:MAG: ABC transporter permease [Bacteroidales bacterium]|nr:ABC transporter permease [Bacteroidales bacterium]
MLKNYFLVACRNFLRNKLFTVVNILGLATGLACFLLISLYVENELSYDKHHGQSDLIYRITLDGSFGGNDIRTATTGGRVGELAENEIPEILSHATVFRAPESVLLRVGEKQFYQDGILYADSGFFNLFTYDFLSGDPLRALAHPYSVVITEALAKKCFGDADPLGQVIEWDNQHNMVVQGVVRDPVHNSHLRFNAMASLTTFQTDRRMWHHVNSLSIFITHNYILVQKGTPVDLLASKLTEMIQNQMRETIEQYNLRIELVPQPITDIYLTSKLIQELGENSDYSRIYIFSAIALLILTIACINFINLSTATSSKRAREVGIRKVFGAERSMLFRQFILESFIITFIAMLVALAVVEVCFPYFREFAGIAVEISWWSHKKLALLLLGLLLTVGLMSGFYPALVLSAFQPVKVLKGKLFKHSARPVFRNVLVIVQFTISVLIIFSAVVIYRQMDYLGKKDLGIEISQVIIAPLRDRNLISRYETLQSELRNVPGVVDVSASSTVMGTFDQRQTYYPEGSTRQHAEMLSYLQTDYNFLEVYQAELMQGRSFSKTRNIDSASIIINESMARKFGWDEPLGKHLILPGGGEEASDQRYKVIGVVKDFHFTSLHNNIEPLLIELNPLYFRNLNIRIEIENMQSTLSRIESKWLSLVPDRPFDYFFFDERFNSLYMAEQKMSGIFMYFSFLALFIASLGLFGLALYTTERRTKEIGVRKVFGAPVIKIVFKLLAGFTQWVLLANLIAWPLSWYFMHKWLQNFAYQTQISWWIFLIPASITLLIAVATVSWQSFRTATQNPVKALSYE